MFDLLPRFITVFCLLIAILISQGCSFGNKKNAQINNPPHTALFSPNGEMLSGGSMGNPSCEEAYGNWFDRLDVKKEGIMSHDTFIADTNQQFSRMDINHDGNITASELTQYRSAYGFDPSLGFSTSRRVVEHNDQFSDMHKADLMDNKAPSWAKNTWTPDAADPVMSADRHLKFRVTREDFLAQAEEIFSWLDDGHQGFFSRQRLLNICSKTKK